MPGFPGGLHESNQNLFNLGDFQVDLLEEVLADIALLAAESIQGHEILGSGSRFLTALKSQTRHLFGCGDSLKKLNNRILYLQAQAMLFRFRVIFKGRIYLKEKRLDL